LAFAASFAFDPPISSRLSILIASARCGAASYVLGTTDMQTGTVKFYNGQKGFGFIQPEDGSKDVFVHISALDRAGLGGLVEGQKVNYELETGRDGRTSAANLQTV
jgi:CspA family cold shock protein